MAAFAPDTRYPTVPQTCKAERENVLSLFNLAGKTALITGGNGGIGGGMATGLAEAGADIIIMQIPGEKSSFASELSEATGRRVDVYECDLAKPENIRAIVANILDRDGRKVNILCNCAGIGGGWKSVLQQSDAHRELVTQIHFGATYVLSQLLGDHMAKRGEGGKIINIASLAADRAFTRFSVYGPMKAAIGQLTNSLANEFAIYNIQVNCLYPGWIDTPLSKKTVENEEVSRELVSRIPAGRWGKPHDFKGISVFLASAASDYVTGARIYVDGGTHGM